MVCNLCEVVAKGIVECAKVREGESVCGIDWASDVGSQDVLGYKDSWVEVVRERLKANRGLELSPLHWNLEVVKEDSLLSSLVEVFVRYASLKLSARALL